MRAWRSMTYPLARLAAFPFHHPKWKWPGRLAGRSFLGRSNGNIVAALATRLPCATAETLTEGRRCEFTTERLPS